ncbi:alpha/beta fold hydrolase [Agrobacterium sp. NPDC089420]|uniref:alpha/beta fold hydrolase n=1 Tax=Agrobacterium sp. NPDC089420 TaxID=3363918 RepID=UPI00384C872E
MTVPTIVFLPGLLCDGQLWEKQVNALGDVAPAIVADLTLDDTIAGMAQRVTAHAGGRFVIIALSMGGYVAFELLRQFPDRIAGAALLDTSAAPDTPAKAAARLAGIKSLALGRFTGVTSRLLPQLVHHRHLGGPVAQGVQDMALRVGGEAYVRQQRAILGRVDSRPHLSAITVPTLIGVGAEDILTPLPESELLHAYIPGSRLHVFEECGHLPPLEKPEETTRLLRDWLTASVLSA